MSSRLSYSSLSAFFANASFSLISFCFFSALSDAMNVINFAWSCSSSTLDSLSTVVRAFYFSVSCVISCCTVLYASSAWNISFFWSMNSFMLGALWSRGNCTRDLAMCIAACMYPRWLELKLSVWLSVSSGFMSVSLTLRRGALDVAVFLFQIF